jgi:hypothetical protein
VDYELSDEQRDLLNGIDEIVTSTGGAERAFAISVQAGYDAGLDRALEMAGLLRGGGLLERVLVAERLAELGAATTYGLRGVASTGADLPPGGLAIASADRHGPVRYGAQAGHIALISGEDVIIAEGGAQRRHEVPSGFGYPYARIGPGAAGGRTLAGEAAAWRARLALVTAAEIAGHAAAALARTAGHMKVRTQFGHSLSAFQALRHRFAEAAVSAEATRWLVREAAFSGDHRDMYLAASYAAQAAAQLVPEVVQMCGARSFTLEFGLHVFTMRLDGLRLELGAPDRLAARVLTDETV